MNGSSKPPRRIGLALLGLLLAACTSTRAWHDVPPPWNERTFAGEQHVRLVDRDGRRVELDAPRWVDRAEGSAVEGRVAGSKDDELVPVSAVVRVETARAAGRSSLGNVATWTLVAIVVLVIASAIAVASLDLSFSLGA